MLTSEQVVEYLIMIDLQRKGAENKLNAEGLSTLLDLQSDKELKDIKIVDVLDYIHTQEEEIKEYNDYFKSFGCKDFVEFQRLIALTKISANDKERDDIIRKQICEKIRNAIEVARVQEMWEGKSLNISKILDKIEKGEE